MTYSYAQPAERFSLALARRWLLIYPLAQAMCVAVTFGCGLLAPQLAQFDPAQVTLAATIIAAAAYGLTFGYLRGRLLRTKLSRLSLPMWCGAIALLSLYVLPPDPQALPGLPTGLSNLQAVVIKAMPLALSGFVYGLAIGAVEAVALRRASLNVAGWVVWSGFAWGVGHITASAALAYAASMPHPVLPPDVMNAAGMILQALIAGLFILPALGQLTPRLNYYGPRVYRTTLRAPAQT